MELRPDSLESIHLTLVVSPNILIADGVFGRDTRLFVYVAIPIELYVRRNTIDVVRWVFIAILIIEMVSGYVRIRDRL